MLNHAALATAILAARAAAHGFVQTWTLDGKAYEGYDRWAERRDPAHIGWSYSTEDEGPELDIASPNLACRRDGKAATAYGTVAAGGAIDLFWTSSDKEVNPDGWAVSHHGPMLLYIAPCGADCTTVDKTQLKWTKIGEVGVVSGSANDKGTWATDVMHQNAGHTQWKLPASIKAGNYVLRSEIIALHKAHEKIPEFYPQCGNIKVTGAGTDDLSASGVVSAQLYSKSDQIFGFDLYNSGKTTFQIPGPKLYTGAGAPAQGQNGATTTTSTVASTTPVHIPTTLVTMTTTSAAAAATSTAPEVAEPEVVEPEDSDAGDSQDHEEDEEDDSEVEVPVPTSSIIAPTSTTSGAARATGRPTGRPFPTGKKGHGHGRRPRPQDCSRPTGRP